MRSQWLEEEIRMMGEMSGNCSRGNRVLVAGYM